MEGSKARKKWSDLNVTLHDGVRKGIESFNFEFMTTVQAITIPQLLQKKDVSIETGVHSGKTLAFLIPLLEILLKRDETQPWTKNEVGAIVISPTIDLGKEISDVLKRLLVHVPKLEQLLLVGDRGIEEDFTKIRNGSFHIIVCTPGRLEDLLNFSKDGYLVNAVKSLEVLILDDANRLLDLGFEMTINTILTYLPTQRCAGLFSPTLTKELDKLIQAALCNPVVCEEVEQSVPRTLENHYIVTNKGGKLATIVAFFDKFKVNKALLFLPTNACVDFWSQILERLVNGKRVFALTENKKKRGANWSQRVKDFKKCQQGLLLCTDNQTKVVDIPEVDCVIQWDPPADPAVFVERVQYAARQDQKGTVVTLLVASECDYTTFIKEQKQVELVKMKDPTNNDHHQRKRVTEKLRSFISRDRNLMTKCDLAFISHVRTYPKVLFKDVPLAGMVECYGLFKLPQMRELKGQSIGKLIGYKAAEIWKRRCAELEPEHEEEHSGKRPHEVTEQSVDDGSGGGDVKKMREHQNTNTNNQLCHFDSQLK